MSHLHRRPRLPALLLGLALALGALGGQPLAHAETAPVVVDGAELGAELRGEYLVGQPVLVPVTVRNPGQEPLTFDDLAARPWLVRFELVLPDGRKVRRSTAAPDQDSGRTVRIPVRAQRRTLLEVPSAQATEAGSYQLAVQLVRGEQSTDLVRRDVRFAPARPVAGDLGPDGLAGAKVGLQAAWVHQAGEGFDLYLDQASSQDPTRAGTSRHLLHLEQQVVPWLAAARTAEATAPVVVWSTGPRSLRVLRVDSTGVVDTDRTVDAPWPKVEIAGRPGVAAGGMVGVPLWVPDPTGTGGELRVAAIGPGNFAGFAKVARFAERPDQLETTVDSGGAVQVLVSHSGGLDLYALRAGDVVDGQVLPPAGRRLLAAEAGTTRLRARFGVLPESASHAGGLAVFVLGRTEAALSARWLDLQGNQVSVLPALPPPPAGELVGILPSDSSVGLLSRSGSGLLWTEGATSVPVQADGTQLQVVRDASGRAVLRRFAPGAPVRAQLLVPTAP